MERLVKHRGKILKAALFVLVYSLIPLVGLVFYMNLGQREEAIQSAKTDVNNIVKEIVVSEQNITSRTEYLLITLSKLSEVQNHDVTKCDQLFAKLLKQYPLYKNLFVSDLQGNVFCSAVPLTKPINIADRSYFVHAISSRNLSLGDYQIGRLVNVPVWIAGYPVLSEDGVIKGVVSISLDLSWLNNFLRLQPLPPQSTIKIFDEQGIMLSSYPSTKYVGKDLSSVEEIKMALAGDKTPFQVKGIDGITRLYSYSQLSPVASGKKKYILVGIPEAIIYRQVESDFRRNLTVALAIIIVVFIITLVNWRLFIYQEDRSRSL